MGKYKEIAQLFEEKTTGIDFFINSSVAALKRSLQQILENETKQLLFLIGEPGVGKSVFLRHFDRLFENRYKTILFDMPFLEPVDFIKMLIKNANESVEDFSLDAMIKQVVSIYRNSNYIVLFDESQLLSKQMIEVIRILADSKAFWFVLAMHKHESKSILNEPQFASRPHKVLELGKLSRQEYKEYLYTEFRNTSQPYLAEEISGKYLKKLYKLTDGNFRDLKKLLFHLFLLIDYAHESGKRKYQKPSSCLITMAAIEGGLLHV